MRARATPPSRDVDARATVRTEHDVVGFVTRTCFKTGPPGGVGVESEWLLRAPGDGTRPVRTGDVDALLYRLGDLPARSRVTIEPGGQVELSTVCADSVADVTAALRADLRHLDTVLTALGWRRDGLGCDPVRPAVRLATAPRYAAMETYFDADGPTGRDMMCRTASVQICLDAGAGPADQRQRWHLLNRLAPVLTGVFANSPVVSGRPTGWASTRQRIWAALDPFRTAAPTGDDPVEAWARYALAAPVMMIRRESGPWVSRPGITFADWLQKGPAIDGLAHPTYDDLAYHLTTLFPPVRPRGWLELRTVDALPDEHWPVAVAVTTALLEDRRAADLARDRLQPLPADAGARAARDGMADRAMRAIALGCLAAALDALPRIGVPAEVCAAADRFVDRYPDAGRTPGDDVLDGMRREEAG